MAVKSPEAPHGYEEDGVTPKAPYGWKADGTPKLSRRGRAPKTSGPTAPGASATQGRGQAAEKARAQRDTLLALADAIVSPAMAATSSPAFAQKVGQRRADGIAGSLVILDGFLPAYADQVVTLSQTRPSMLAWMDKVDDKAPMFALAVVTVQALKSIATNIMHPDPRLAEAARLKAQIRNAEMAKMAEDQARAMGISLVPEPEPVRQHPNPVAEPPFPAGVPV